MIEKNAANELKAWVESRNGVYPAVDAWTIRTAGDGNDKSHPLVVIEVTGAEEHEVLRGVMSPLTMEVRLETIPHASGSSAGATNLSTHEEYSAALYNILADRSAVDWIDLRGQSGVLTFAGRSQSLRKMTGAGPR